MPPNDPSPSRIASLRARIYASFVHLPRSVLLAWRASPKAASAIVVLTLLSALVPLAVAYVGKLIVDAVASGSEALAIRWVLVELALVAVQSLIQRALFLLRALLGARLGTDVNLRILEKAIELPLSQFEDPEFYDRLTRARREASSRPVAIVTDGLQLLQNVLTLFGYVALLVSFDARIVVALAVAALPATLVEMRFSTAAFRLRNWRSADSRRLNYLEYVLANDGHAKEVKIYGLGPLFLSRYRSLAERFYAEDKALSIRRSGWAYVLSLLATGAFYGGYLAIALAAARGRISLGDLTLYLVAFRQGQQAFQSCLTAIGSMYEGNLYMTNLFAFLDFALPPVVVPPVGSTNSADRGLRFDDVGFRYPGRQEWALRHVDLVIPEGKSLALVGHNGAGKSTLIKLLCRLYVPTEGKIWLDGRELSTWPEADLDRRLSVVFQDFNRYQLSARENIGLGDAARLQDDGAIRRAASLGGADEVLAALPESLETPLGRWFQQGVELSGGQWQKMALARAFMRSDADILVLDEPTAALDAEAEAVVFERFRELTRGRTALLISHRFPTVRMADRIVVLAEGRLVEAGTHDELVRAGGLYARLFALQAEGYR